MRQNFDGVYLFNTAIGTCGLAWTKRGMDCVQLPEANVAATKRALLKKSGQRKLVSKPPPMIKDAVERMTRHLGGKPESFKDIKVDLTRCTDFAQCVYRALRKIKPGKVITYGELARLVGNPDAARAVGRAMATNPIPIIIPCHRVISSSGKLGGFSAPRGLALKAELLFIERM